ncbi:MAG: hypothetical protein NVS4B8_04180 [Herpetosiphon sp.]
MPINANSQPPGQKKRSSPVAIIIVGLLIVLRAFGSIWPEIRRSVSIPLVGGAGAGRTDSLLVVGGIVLIVAVVGALALSRARLGQATRSRQLDRRLASVRPMASAPLPVPMPSGEQSPFTGEPAPSPASPIGPQSAADIPRVSSPYAPPSAPFPGSSSFGRNPVRYEPALTGKVYLAAIVWGTILLVGLVLLRASNLW